MPNKYEGRPVKVTIGQAAEVELPPRVFRGHVSGYLFDSDKTFLLPNALGCAKELLALCDEHPTTSMLVIGHTDDTGSEEHNRALSEERAIVVAAFLAKDRPEFPGR